MYLICSLAASCVYAIPLDILSPFKALAIGSLALKETAFEKSSEITGGSLIFNEPIGDAMKPVLPPFQERLFARLQETGQALRGTGAAALGHIQWINNIVDKKLEVIQDPSLRTLAKVILHEMGARGLLAICRGRSSIGTGLTLEYLQFLRFSRIRRNLKLSDSFTTTYNPASIGTVCAAINNQHKG